jgi:predicted MFS family arabinose efflux permease
MGSGGYFSLQSSIVAQIVGSHRVGAAIGAIELVSSIGEYLLQRGMDEG